jgi:hypothetical protein
VDFDHSQVAWRKSSRSAQGANGVEISAWAGYRLVRDSKNPDGPQLSFDRLEWHGFTVRVKAGELAHHPAALIQ